MKYMGSKNRIAKYILPIMLEHRKEGQYWVEPFVGGGNMIDKVGGKRIGSDSNKYLIALLKEMQTEGFLAPLITKETYLDIKNNIDNYPLWLVGFAGFQLSYGAMWFHTYRWDKTEKRDYAVEAKKNIDKQAKRMGDINFILADYRMLVIPKESILYCDPPYLKTFRYESVETFDSPEFWQWCRDKTKEGHTVFVSEYNAPEDFKCIWSKEINSSLTKNTGSKKGAEKLFTYSRLK